MIDDPKQIEKVHQVMQKRDPGAYEACPKRKCPMFDIIDIAPGTVMYYCTQHGLNGQVVVQ